MRRPASGLVSHGWPPVCGPRPLRAPAARAASRRPPARPRPDLDDVTLRRARRRARRGARRGSPCGWAMRTDRRRAAGAELPQERALRGGRRPGLGIVDLGERGASTGSSARHCTASAPWPGAGSIRLDRQPLGRPPPASPSRRTPAAASRTASYSPSRTLRIRVSTFPRIERTLELRPQRASPAPPGAGCSSRARRPPRARRAEGPRATTTQSRTSSRAHTAADREPRRILRREILERVNREVDLAVAAARARAPP